VPPRPPEPQYGNAKLAGSGWSIKGGGRVASKASFNLLGGYISFDMDTTKALTGVNNNFYTTSPTKANFPKYCDIQSKSDPCLEMDFVENNGNCVAQTTWHTSPAGPGNCDRGGCGGTKPITGGGRFHVKAAFAADGWMTVAMDGAAISVSPTPDDAARGYVQQTMALAGAQVHSSQWTGWVPGGNCGGSGSLGDSAFSVSNVRVMGAVVQGPEPTRCAVGRTIAEASESSGGSLV
jgi:hypothetical protein